MGGQGGNVRAQAMLLRGPVPPAPSPPQAVPQGAWELTLTPIRVQHMHMQKSLYGKPG